ncbi:MAG: hypothetical protein IT378_02050 [Sandaracinaceae bacterium]|nr:hypothetical protein [Sandaracinaceae bacterium]
MRAALLLPLCALLACGESHVGEPGELGDDCSAGCAAGLACVQDTLFPGGYCSAGCGGASTCPAGGACDPRLGVCLAPCAAPTDCRDGYQCWQGRCAPLCEGDGACGVPGATCADGRCVAPPCTLDTDCGAAMRCAGGRCEPIPLDGGTVRPDGAPCGASGECASGICAPSAFGGVCTLECAQPGDCFVFDFEAGCAAVPWDDDGDATPNRVRALCVPLAVSGAPNGNSCTADAECAVRTCHDGQCTEGCGDDGDCLVGQTCTTLERSAGTFRGCGYAARQGEVEITSVDLGERDVTAGEPIALSLAVPPDTVSITLQGQVLAGDPLDLVFGTVTSADRRVLFDLDEIAILRDQPIRWIPDATGESITMLVPNTTPDRAALAPGLLRWTMGPRPRTSGDTGRATVAASVVVKRARDRTVTAGSLDLHVHLVGVGLTAATAPTNARLMAALARLDTILSAASLRVRNVTYEQVADADATRYRVIDSTDGPTSELAGLFRLARGGQPVVHVFLVRSINSGGGGFRALGVAGDVPGPVDLSGTANGGVVCSFDSAVIETGAMVGHVLAHEISHYLGLYHVTEQARPCGPGEIPGMVDCAPFGAGDVLADTDRGDTTNLMHWSIVGSGTNFGLTAGQGVVLRASALSRP